MRHALFSASLIGLAACGGETTAPASDESGRPLVVMSAGGEDLAIASGYARPATRGGNSAGYVAIRSDAADALTGATSTAFEVVELHETTRADGTMRMRPVERIDLPAGETVRLAPGGLHIMLIGARAEVAEGGTVPIYLEFGSGRSVAFDLPVERR